MRPLALDESDRELIAAARDCLERNFTPGCHTVGCAVRMASGKVYCGVNVEACGYGPCAEPIAVGAAFTAGEREIAAIVAVCRGGEEYAVVSPCGNCRQLVLDYSPEAMVIFDLDGEAVKATARELLPGAYRSNFREE